MRGSRPLSPPAGGSDTGVPGTEKAPLAAFKKFSGKEMAQCFLNSGNLKFERAPEDWVTTHGYTKLQIPGGSATWGSGN
jgi:hypothetical protein